MFPPIDVQTLLLVSTLVLALLGAMFLVSWVQNREETALAHWGASLLAAAPAVTLLALRGQVADWASIGVANAMVLSAYGLFLSGVLAFDRGESRWALVLPVLCVGAWSIANFLPGFHDAFIWQIGRAHV